MEYRLTQRGRNAEIKPTPSGKILDYMQNGHGVVNHHEINYELQMGNAQAEMDNLVKAGYLSKEEASSNPLGDIGIG